MEKDIKHISVCICTFKRQYLLGKLLEKLKRQNTENLFKYSVIVADNDYLQSAKDVVQTANRNSKIEFEYFCEERQNISLARNCALRNAKGDYIALIDDDEMPIDSWLKILFKECRELNADGIQGPVIPLFPRNAPNWVKKTNFYKRPDYPTGMELAWRQGRTGNLFFRRKIIEGIENPFNPEFGSGAEDQDFFKRMITKGYNFKYCDHATVLEIIPPQRLKIKFLIKRALLRGKIATKDPYFNLLGIVKSFLAILIYVSALPVFMITGRHFFIEFFVKVFDHIGKILAFFKINVTREVYIV